MAPFRMRQNLMCSRYLGNVGRIGVALALRCENYGRKRMLLASKGLCGPYLHRKTSPRNIDDQLERDLEQPRKYVL